MWGLSAEKEQYSIMKMTFKAEVVCRLQPNFGDCYDYHPRYDELFVVFVFDVTVCEIMSLNKALTDT